MFPKRCSADGVQRSDVVESSLDTGGRRPSLKGGPNHQRRRYEIFAFWQILERLLASFLDFRVTISLLT